MKDPENQCRRTLDELGTMIRTARDAAGLGQAIVEANLGYSAGLLSSLETNRKNTIWTVDTIRRVAKEVGADVDKAVSLVLQARLYRSIAQTQGKFTEKHLRAALRAVLADK